MIKTPYKLRIQFSQELDTGEKIPNQWKYWCKAAKLRPHHSTTRTRRGSNWNEWMYLKGLGYVWRITANSMFERGDSYEDFDRWALCDSNEVKLPQSKEEFLKAVDVLVKANNP